MDRPLVTELSYQPDSNYGTHELNSTITVTDTRYGGNTLNTVPVVNKQSPVIISKQSNIKERSVKVYATLGLGICEVILGFICGFALVISDTDHSSELNGYGHYFGIPGIITCTWILISGICGFISSGYPSSYWFNRINYGLNVVACFLAFIAIILLIIAMIVTPKCDTITDECKTNNTSSSLGKTLIFYHVINFTVAFTAAIFCGKYQTVSGDNDENIDHVINQQVYVSYQPQSMQQMYTTTSSAGNIIVSAPPTSYPVSAPHYAPQSAAYYPNQAVASQANYTQAGATSVTYSTEQPPQYQEKVSTDPTVVSM